MLNRDRAHALLESPIHLIRNRDASKFWMANATGQVSNMSVLREETTTSSQREISTNGGGLDSPAEVTSLIAGNSFCLTPGNNGGIGVQKKATTGAGLKTTQRATDATKRKKLRSRNVPPSPLAQKTEAATTSLNQTNIGEAKRTELNYSKDHLDAWLENCLRDATNAQLSSSSEFLDFIPPTAPAHKQMFLTQQQQLPQLKQQLQQQRQQEFSKRTQPYGVGPSTPFSLGIQRNSSSLSHRYPMLFPPQSLSSYGMSFGGDGGQEFASLPPLNNMMGGPEGLGCEHEPNSTDVLDGSGSNPNLSKGFRFSDPCLLNPSDNDSKLSGQNTPECRNVNNNGSGCDLAHQNKFFAALMEQINILHDTNSKICRNLHDTKEEQLEEQVGLDGGELSLTGNNSLSCSSIGLQTPSNLTLHSQIPKSEQQAVRSPPSFALISDQINPGIPPPLLPRKKDHAHLKRELSEAASVPLRNWLKT
ncbi:GD19717 [Drosophila simulans]|uniref:GD19717 n=1 Tax=Drosophila simulans TaxID=7240 RepID=B4QV02_DROSI|nr:GD19717 [Drosophila simulans]